MNKYMVNMIHPKMIVQKGLKGCNTTRTVTTFAQKNRIPWVWWKPSANQKIMLVDWNQFREVWKKGGSEFGTTTDGNRTHGIKIYSTKSYGNKGYNRGTYGTRTYGYAQDAIKNFGTKTGIRKTNPTNRTTAKTRTTNSGQSGTKSTYRSTFTRRRNAA